MTKLPAPPPLTLRWSVKRQKWVAYNPADEAIGTLTDAKVRAAKKDSKETEA